MTRLEARTLHTSAAITAATGIIYPVMHYLMKRSDPFSVVNNPLEPYMLYAHILAAPVLILLIGVILHSHVLHKLRFSRIGRKSGIVLLILFALMTASGYLLQVVTGNARNVMIVVHLATGSTWAVCYVIHQLATWRARRLASRRSELYADGL